MVDFASDLQQAAIHHVAGRDVVASSFQSHSSRRFQAIKEEQYHAANGRLLSKRTVASVITASVPRLPIEAGPNRPVGMDGLIDPIAATRETPFHGKLLKLVSIGPQQLTDLARQSLDRVPGIGNVLPRGLLELRRFAVGQDDIHGEEVEPAEPYFKK